MNFGFHRDTSFTTIIHFYSNKVVDYRQESRAVPGVLPLHLWLPLNKALLTAMSVAPTVVTWNSAMSACSSAALWQRSLLLWFGMPKQLIQPETWMTTRDHVVPVVPAIIRGEIFHGP